MKRRIVSLIIVLLLLGTMIPTGLVKSYAEGIPASSYQKTGEVYTVSGQTYYVAKTTKAYNGVATGQLFFLDSSNRVVQSQAILNKLYTIELYKNCNWYPFRDTADSLADMTEIYLETFSGIVWNQGLTWAVTTATSLLSGIATGDVADIAGTVISIGTDIAASSPDNTKTLALLSLVELYQHNISENRDLLYVLTRSRITDYDKLKNAMTSYAECLAGKAAIEYLIGDEIKQIAQSGETGQLADYFWSVLTAFIPDWFQVAYSIVDNVMALSDVLSVCDVDEVFEAKKNDTLESCIPSSNYTSLKTAADKLAGSEPTVNQSSLTPSGDTYTNDPIIAARLDTLFNTYKPGKSFFTKNGKACSCHASSSIDCVSTASSSCNCLRYITYNGKRIDLGASQCFGYARYCQQILFGANEFTNANKFKQLSGQSSLTATTVKQWFTNNKSSLHTGAHIRVYGSSHSICLLNVDYTKGIVYYLECNWTSQSSNNGTWCQVNPIRANTWKEFASKYGSIAYAKVYKDYSSSFSHTLSITFNANGGDISSDIYYLDNSTQRIRVYETSAEYKQTWTYGSTHSAGLRDDTSFGLYHDGYSFVGWRSSYNNQIYAKDVSLSPETLVPELINGDQSIEMSAVWERNIPINVNIAFDANGGDGQIGDVIVTQGSYFSVPSEGFTFTGNNLYGWTIRREDGKWLCQGGWRSENELSSGEYQKMLVTVGSDLDIDSTFVNYGDDFSCTFYAVWQDSAIESISVAAVEDKNLYYANEIIDVNEIVLNVKNVDGSVRTVTEGFDVYPMTLLYEGTQTITVSYGGLFTEFGVQVTDIKRKEVTAVANKTIDCYYLPNSNATKLTSAVASGDICIILCQEGNYYLGLFPFGATSANFTNGFLGYFPIDSFADVSGNVPYFSEYYTMNPTLTNNAVANQSVPVYHRPATTTITGGSGINLTSYESLSSGQSVRVLFEMMDKDGSFWYCVRTSTSVGYVRKSAITLNPIVTGVSSNIDELKVNFGETVSNNDFSVFAKLSDGTQVLVNDYQIELPDVSVPGVYFAEISYSSFKTFIKIVVNNPKLSGIVVSAAPNKTIYPIGAVFDQEGLVLSAVYDTGDIGIVLDNYHVSYNFSEPGYSMVTIEYNGFYASQSVYVYELPLVQVSDAAGYKGETVNISVGISNYTDDLMINANSFLIGLTYNPNALQYKGLTISDEIDPTRLTVNPDTNGNLVFSYTGVEALGSDATLFDIQFRIVADSSDEEAENIYPISLSQVNLYNDASDEIEVDVENGSVNNLGLINVSFDANGGENTPVAIENCVYGQIVVIPDTIPTLEGYLFEGWSKLNDISALNLHPGDVIELQETMILYATWKSAASDEPSTPVVDTSPKRITINDYREYTVSIDGAEDYYTSELILDLDFNSEVVLTAVDIDNFAYWKNSANVVVSRVPEFTFRVTITEAYTAVYNTKARDKVTIIFESLFDQVISRTQVSLNGIDDLTMPAGPSRFGYIFEGWQYDLDEIKTIAQSVLATADTSDDVIVIKPEYTLIPETKDIIVNGGTGSGTYDIESTVTISANEAPEGYKFSHWINSSGEVVSYRHDFTFFVMVDEEYTAVFVDENEEIVTAGIATITEVVKDFENRKISFASFANVPDGFNILNAGVVATSDGSIGHSPGQFTTESAMYVRGSASANTASRFVWTKSNVGAETWFVRAFITYMDDNGNTFTTYSDIVSASLSLDDFQIED